MTAINTFPGAAISLLPSALFAKLSASTDYSWYAGERDLPPGSSPLLETLGQHAAETRAQIVLLFQDGTGGQWLARTYTSLVDAVGRPAPAVEVLRIASPATLSPELGLRLVAEALDWRVREHREPFTCDPPTIEHAPQPLSPQEADRARLGLRLTLAPLQALDLVRRPGPWRYRGLCYARLSAGGCVAWLEALHPFLCINFDNPPAAAEEQVLLHAAGEHPPRAAEWEALDRLPVSEVRRAFAWLDAGSPVPAPVRPGDPLAPWTLLWFQRQAAPGPELLSLLLANAGGEEIELQTLLLASPGLSAAAVQVLRSAGDGDEEPLSLGVSEELAQGGYLGSAIGRMLALRRWAVYAASSEIVGHAAVERLERVGFSHSAARFFLDLPPAERDDVVPEREAIAAVADLDLPVPRGRLLGALQRVASPEQIERLVAVAEAYPGWGRAFGEGLSRPGAPAGQLLEPEVWIAILAARRRVLGDASGWRDILAALVRAEEIAAAGQLLALLQGQSGLAMPAEIAAVLGARLGQRPPAPAPLASVLEPLVQAGLARPEDIVLSPDGGRVADWAHLWPATLPLARLFEGSSDGALPPVPPTWRAAVCDNLPPERLARWITATRELRHSDVMSWVADLLEVPQRKLQALLAGRALDDEATTARSRPWLAPLLTSLPRLEALQALAAQIRLGLFIDDENGAVELVHALVPDDGDAAHELATHALCRIGSIPQLDGVPPDLATAVVERLPPLEVVAAALRMTDIELNLQEGWLEAVAGLVSGSHAVCPEKGYLKHQLKRHPALAERLSHLDGWEKLQAGRPIRIRIALALVRLLGLSPEDLSGELPAPSGADVPTPVVSRRKR